MPRSIDPIVRATLIIITILSLLGLAWLGGEWARLNFVPSPTPVEPPADAFIQHVGYEAAASQAIAALAAMPAGQQQALRENLRANLVPVEEGLARLDASPVAILCIGERHMASTRRFLAETVLPAFRTDALLLETSPEELPDILNEIDSGRTEVPLLGEDIAAIVRAVRAANPRAVIAGIDESASQKAQRVYRKQGSRDASITGNLRSYIRRGKRHVVLFGALHCADQPNWLYRRVSLAEHRIKREQIVNLNVIGEHQDGTLEAFLEFVDAIGIPRRNFMITDTGALDARLFTWFPGFTRTFLRFDSVLVFQEHAHTHSRAAPGPLE